MGKIPIRSLIPNGSSRGDIGNGEENVPIQKPNIWDKYDHTGVFTLMGNNISAYNLTSYHTQDE